jgi:hypothetical protein
MGNLLVRFFLPRHAPERLVWIAPLRAAPSVGSHVHHAAVESAFVELDGNCWKRSLLLRGGFRLQLIFYFVREVLLEVLEPLLLRDVRCVVVDWLHGPYGLSSIGGLVVTRGGVQVVDWLHGPWRQQ